MTLKCHGIQDIKCMTLTCPVVHDIEMLCTTFKYHVVHDIKYMTLKCQGRSTCCWNVMWRVLDIKMSCTCGKFSWYDEF
jgi:hypothetical protein